MARSEYITGRRATKQAFLETIKSGGCFAVLCYRVGHGYPVRYADPSYVGPRKGLTPPKRKTQARDFRYRVIVHPKRIRE